MEAASKPEDGLSVWASWTWGARQVHAFSNGRSALAFLLRATNTRRVWLPDYSCPELAAAAAGLDLRFYGLDRSLNPDLDRLGRRLRRDDSVIIINHFGRPPRPEWKDLIKARSDVTWVEDCAQALDTGAPALGDYRIYSPRKLLGVPDGGLLVDYAGRIARPELTNEPLRLLSRPYKLRAADPDSEIREIWHRAFREAEAAMVVENRAMSTESIHVLKARAIGKIAARRRANYRYLGELLGHHCLFRDTDVSWVPLGFPIITQEADRLVTTLARSNVFAPRHWRKLPAPLRGHRDAHWLANRLVTIPCDQRYDRAEMKRIADLVNEAIN